MNDGEKILSNFKGIIDTTLREGYQFRHAHFNLKQQKKILKYLAKIGVDRIEVGNPIKDDVKKSIVALCEDNSNVKFLCHVRNRLEDIQSALSLKIFGVNILCTVDSERLESMHTTFEQYLDNLKKNIDLLKSKEIEIRVSVEDFFTQDKRRTLDTYLLADNLGVERIGVADTLGKAMTWEIEERIAFLRSKIKADIEVHLHNDLGHSVANALSALKGGANWIDTTILGIGERTGITPLSLFLANMYILDPDLVKKYNLSLLTKAENYLAKTCGIPVPFNILTNRTNGFTHKAGIHLNALIKHGPHKYELLPPKVVGNQRILIYNSSISGRTNKEDVLKFYETYGK